jgi:hypothetical protein
VQARCVFDFGLVSQMYKSLSIFCYKENNGYCAFGELIILKLSYSGIYIIIWWKVLIFKFCSKYEYIELQY